MSSKPPLAVFGANPGFREPLPVGQFYWPEWDAYERAARDIFSRRYYAAQRVAGPLLIQFQQRLEAFLGVKHAIAVRSATNGLMNVACALGLRGKVLVPSWTSIATIESLWWYNCEPVFCDIDPESQQMSLPSARHLLEGGGIRGILGVHLWGNALPVDELETLAREFGVALYYDAAHAFGCQAGQRAIGGFGCAEVFSFHAANILSTAEGGCITTNDDELADKLRAMRGDHMPGIQMQTATSRVSEIQAAVGLAVLDDFDRNRRNNEEQHRCYENRLSATPGIRILKRSGVTRSNFQSFVAMVDSSEFGLTRDELLAVLAAENVAAERQYYPASHQAGPFSDTALAPGQLKNTEAAARCTFQLPLGSRVTAAAIGRICDIVCEAQIHAPAIKSLLASRGTT